MKIKSSHYVLIAEILIIALIHTIKIRQSEKSPADVVFTPVVKTVYLHKTAIENKTVITYMLLNFVK